MTLFRCCPGGLITYLKTIFGFEYAIFQGGLISEQAQPNLCAASNFHATEFEHF